MIALDSDELVIDGFCGGGGASTGIEDALDRPVDVALNHDEPAIVMHAANHPETVHVLEDIIYVHPEDYVKGRRVGLGWFSPDCTEHSKAKGGKPRNKGIRTLPWVVVGWMNAVRPRVIILENVEEFEDWGPLDAKDKPIKVRKGETFKLFVKTIEDAGYVVEWRVLAACDYGAPTTRKRLYLIARCDGVTIEWPWPTHGEGLQAYRTAAECIDFDEPMASIFWTKAEARKNGFPRVKRPLEEATLKRIAEGVRRYVLTAARPFLVNLSHGGRVNSLDEPIGTITATPKGGDRMLIAPTLINTRNGERRGQRPRTHDIQKPLPTVTAQGSQGALVAVHLTKFYGTSTGSDVGAPMPTITGGGKHLGLCAAFLAKHNGSGDTWDAAIGQGLDEPVATITGRDTKALITAHLERNGNAEAVAAFIVKYYGSGSQWSSLDEPMHTIVSRARMGLVTVQIDGESFALTDLRMRMLTPRELARAQGFPDSYILTGTKEQQIGRIGNSVCPPVARALVEANFGRAPERMAAK